MFINKEIPDFNVKGYQDGEIKDYTGKLQV